MAGANSELPDWECWALLGSLPVGRIVIVDHEHPIAIPLNFRVIESEGRRQIVVRTAATTVVGRYEGLASFEVDHIDATSRQAWSVLVRGRLRCLTDHTGLPDPDPWFIEHRGHWMALDATSISGRRFTGRTSDDGYSVEWEIAPG